mgnify:CR=1 FL=1
MSEQSLESMLAAFDRPPTQGVVSSPMTASPRTEVVEELNAEEATPEEDLTEGSEGVSEEAPELSEQEGTTEEEDNVEEEEEVESDFASQFESYFGMKPDEAVEVVSDLQNFKSEMMLMRDWVVTRTVYEQRMTAVGEIYNSLPEDVLQFRDELNKLAARYS